jgi:hypothetical protein
MLKDADLKEKFANEIIKKYGYAKWDKSIIVNNANMLKTVIVPVADTNNNVQLLIFAYQIDKYSAAFKIINKNTKQNKLPIHGDKKGSTFTQQTLNGLFQVLENNLKSASSKSNNSNNVIISNGIIIQYYCWYYTSTDEFGNFTISNTQCSYHLIFTPEVMQTLVPAIEDFPSGGAVNDYIDYDCINSEIGQFVQSVNESTMTSEVVEINYEDLSVFTKNKSIKWKCLNGFGGWSLISQETGVIKLIDPNANTWSWVSISHNGITMEGATLPGTQVTFSNGVGTPSFTPETAANSLILYGGMQLDFSVTYTPVCHCAGVPAALLTPRTKNYTNSGLWRAKD